MLSSEREPDSFAGAEIPGQRAQVLGLVDRDRLAAMATRSVKRVFVDGVPGEIGCLDGLRVAGGCQGYRFAVPGFLLTIVDPGSDRVRSATREGREAFPGLWDRRRIPQLEAGTP